ncbi:MAG: pilus assembly PilX N-terminal domain-containing protein [Candidatus Pacebacteria bacterium]|nr:pilus assembly PilX N-terminal domain-containing protein [Candidatus Paceibacterota bacterium]
MKKIISKIKNNKEGFVILFAVTISAILLSIALGVSNIALREVKFSTSAKDTNDAFFAADAGLECAMLYDKSDQDKNIFPGNGTTSSMNCVGRTFTPIFTSPSLWNFVVSGLGNTSQSCAIVTMDKGNPIVTVTSKGYNNGGGTPGVCSPGLNTVERQIELSY